MHIMIDTETLSLQMNAVIAELGYALFELRGDGVTYHASQRLNIDGQIKTGRVLDFHTIQWWMGQNDAARSFVFAKGDYPHLIDYLINEFTHDIPWKEIDGVWSHGAAFDCAILMHTYGLIGKQPPFNYRLVRDTRTLYDVVGMRLEDLIQAELKHSAESDAIAQALSVQKAYRILREKNNT